MNGKTHKYVGTCCGIITAEQLLVSNINSINVKNLIISGILISGSIFSALALDVDKRGTTASKKFPLLATIINKICGHRGLTHTPFIWLIICFILYGVGNIIQPKYLIFVTCLLSCFIFYSISLVIINKFAKNKPLKHCLSFLVGIGLTYILYSQGFEIIKESYMYLLIGIFVGAISHIFLDYFNPMGVPLLFPLTRKKYRILKVSENAGKVFSFIFTILVILNTINIYFGGFTQWVNILKNI